tara:strand:- start:162 stop:551 length:390 start_codon:yes stop_codon:yes gene_type:complete
MKKKVLINKNICIKYMFRNLIHKLSDLFDSLNINHYYDAVVHIIGIVIAAHVAAKAHPLKDHPWNMWYCIILFNLVYIITTAIDYDKVDASMSQLSNPLGNHSHNLINNYNLLLVVGIILIAYSLYNRY